MAITFSYLLVVLSSEHLVMLLAMPEDSDAFGVLLLAQLKVLTISVLILKVGMVVLF